MALRFVRRRRLPDGRVEVFTPKLVNGCFVLADRAVDPQHNKAVHPTAYSAAVSLGERILRA